MTLRPAESQRGQPDSHACSPRLRKGLCGDEGRRSAGTDEYGLLVEPADPGPDGEDPGGAGPGVGHGDNLTVWGRYTWENVTKENMGMYTRALYVGFTVSIKWSEIFKSGVIMPSPNILR